MGFISARRAAITALLAGNFQFDPSGLRNGKNLLGTGEVSPTEVIALLNRCLGNQYSASPHHYDLATTVHVFLPEKQRQQWYIKLYFVAAEGDDAAVFMSVHKGLKKKV